MKSRPIVLAVLIGLAAATPYAQTEVVTPPAALVIEGVPAISAELANQLKPYGDFRPHGMLSWHPVKREILIRRRLLATPQVHLVPAPGVNPQPLTDYPDAVWSATFQPATGEYFLFLRDEGGNEVGRIFRQDVATRAVTPLTSASERVSSLTWTRKGDRIAYGTQPIDRNSPDRKARTNLHVMDPLDPQSDRVLATFDGGGWDDFRFSEDGKRLVFIEYISANESYVWVMDVATGRKRRVTRPRRGETVAYETPRFTRDGKGIFVLSDRGGEFKQIVLLPAAGGKERVLTGHLPYDVDEYDLSLDANRIAFTTNENGSSVLRFIDATTLKEQPRPPLMQGLIGGLEWRPRSSEIGFNMRAARSAGDVFSYDVKTSQVTRWTNGNNPDHNTSEFVEPRLVKWKSFDGREISGFHYHPAAKFTGKRPVIIDIHGGPEVQYRPGFIGRTNYYINELGVAVIYPNVRGSSGFGKSFLKLDDGMKREDSVKDIGALLDWIGEQPDLDAGRVLVTGGSYGGYMALASAVHFSDRIAGAASVVGISNIVTFLERTESYRRDLRRVEYGDERDAAMREHLEKISPLSNASKIKKPLFVVQGRNDPRVPWTEAEQIVQKARANGTPVWYLRAENEGHGFQRKENADYQFYATVLFLRNVLKLP
jgi:dipeptidyl aminopeptidase/acylaminoacyl peptidase